MYMLNETICVIRWQVFAMLGLSGFAAGTIVAKLTNALGF